MSAEHSGSAAMIKTIKSDESASREERLYELWEAGHWSALDVDLSQDFTDWRIRLTDEQRSFILHVSTLFLNGEESVTANLAPFLLAASRHQDRIFLSTQVADEARHYVFFDRFMRQVVGEGRDMVSTLSLSRGRLSSDFNLLLAELDKATRQLSRHPQSASRLAQAIVLYHIMIEGLAQVGQYHLRQWGAATGLLPGLMQGVDNVARDEARHIAFGVSWLRDLVGHSEACRSSATDMINHVFPWVVGSLFPPAVDYAFNVRIRDTVKFAIRVIETRLRRIGIPLHEVPTLVKLGYADSSDVQADRIIALIQSGILGVENLSSVSESAMDVIFVGMRNVALHTLDKQTGLQATIQWTFRDVSPRYLTFGSIDGVFTGVGSAPNPTLSLSCSSADWAQIVMGRMSAFRAALTGRLHIRGDWSLLMQLPNILRLLI